LDRTHIRILNDIMDNFVAVIVVKMERIANDLRKEEDM
jgi:hypothetical protein